MALSVAAREAMMRMSSDKEPVFLFRVTPPAGDPTAGDPRWPLCFVNHPVDVVSNAKTYTAVPSVTARPPDDEEQGDPEFIIALPGAAQDIIDLLRTLEGAPTMEVDLVTLDGSTTQNTVDFEWRGLSVRDVQARDGVEFRCRYENLIDSPYPQYRYSASLYPGLR